MAEEAARRRKKTLTEHLIERRQAADRDAAARGSLMSAERIAELEALGTCNCPACRAIRLKMRS